ncbi:MAG: hypothetical protein ACYCTG_04655 [Ferrimicrobium sp.]
MFTLFLLDSLGAENTKITAVWWSGSIRVVEHWALIAHRYNMRISGRVGLAIHR